MKLDVKLALQEEKSVHCGLAGLTMILDYYGIQTSIENLVDKLQVHKVGTYAPQLGSYMISQGFEVEIISMNPLVFSKGFTVKDEELSAHFQKLYDTTKREDFKPAYKYFKEFVDNSGKISQRIPSEEDIEKEIRHKRPLAALLTSSFLVNKTHPAMNFHFNVITGIDKDSIHVNDPLPNYAGGKKSYKRKDYMYGIYASAYGDPDNACLMTFRKKDN